MAAQELVYRHLALLAYLLIRLFARAALCAINFRTCSQGSVSNSPPFERSVYFLTALRVAVALFTIRHYFCYGN